MKYTIKQTIFNVFKVDDFKNRFMPIPIWLDKIISDNDECSRLLTLNYLEKNSNMFEYIAIGFGDDNDFETFMEKRFYIEIRPSELNNFHETIMNHERILLENGRYFVNTAELRLNFIIKKETLDRYLIKCE